MNDESGNEIKKTAAWMNRAAVFFELRDLI
jgi:hypothetical protein